MYERAIAIIFMAVCAVSGAVDIIAGIYYLKIHAVIIGFASLWFAKSFSKELKDERNK